MFIASIDVRNSIYSFLRDYHIITVVIAKDYYSHYKEWCISRGQPLMDSETFFGIILETNIYKFFAIRRDYELYICLATKEFDYSNLHTDYEEYCKLQYDCSKITFSDYIRYLNNDTLSDDWVIPW